MLRSSPEQSVTNAFRLGVWLGLEDIGGDNYLLNVGHQCLSAGSLVRTLGWKATAACCEHVVTNAFRLGVWLGRYPPPLRVSVVNMSPMPFGWESG